MTELLDQDLLAAVAARLELREPNRDAIETLAVRLSEYFEVEGGVAPFEGVLDAATGVGKTYILAGGIEYFAAKGHRNFAVITPGRTILEKTVKQFTKGDPKSLLGGMEVEPVVITSENFNTAAMRAAMDDDSLVKLYVFTVQALTKPKNSEVGRKTHKFQEGLGTAFYDHLDAQDDLIVFADEHHAYYSEAFSQAVRDLTPYALVGLTATPHKKTPKDAIIFRYPLAAAIADRHVKTPVLVGRKDDRNDEATKLLDGISLLETKHEAVKKYCAANPEVKPVNPVMLVVAPTIDDAERVATDLRDPGFLGGRYADHVLVVHSKKADEDLAKLEAVEDDDSPVRIIISVGMLKEGWDVKNVYVIASLRASVSEILTEQTLGRGLRLPFGAYTGVELLDTLEVLAHEKYDQLLKDKKIINEAFIDHRTRATVTGSGGNEKIEIKTEEVSTTVITDPAAGGNGTGPTGDGSSEVAAENGTGPLIGGLTITDLDTRTGEAKAELEVKEVKPLPGAPELLLPEVVPIKIESKWSLAYIEDEAPFEQLGKKLSADPENELRRTKLSAVVKQGPDGLKTTELKQEGVADRVAGVSIVMPLEKARTELFSRVWSTGVVPQKAQEMKALYALIDALIAGMGPKAAELLSSYMDRAAGKFIELLNAEQKRYQPKAQYEDKVTLRPFAPVRQGRPETTTNRFGPFKKSLGYEGWTRSMYEQVWFDSSTERDLAALILDTADDITSWVRLLTRDLEIRWDGGNYNPDFVAVDQAGIHWLVEVKADMNMKEESVQGKRAAARAWAKRVSYSESGAEWRYLLVSESDIKEAKGSWAALKATAS
jgi:type III restriction enzyme